MSHKIEMVGRKFNKLTVIKLAKSSKSGRLMWLCACECGNTKIVEGYHLRKNKIKSCGCLQKQRAHEANLKNGASVGYKRLPEYVTWCSIKDRCNNPNNKSFNYYGGRGINIDSEWNKDFLKFYNDVGKKPKAGYSIERIDVNKGYVPGNCAWIPVYKQARNKQNTHRIIIDGKNFDLKTLAEKTTLDWDFLYYWLIVKTR